MSRIHRTEETIQYCRENKSRRTIPVACLGLTLQEAFSLACLKHSSAILTLKKDSNYQSSYAPQLQKWMDTHSFIQLKFTISPYKRKTQNNNSSLDHPDYGHVEFEHNDLGLSTGQSSYSEMTHSHLLLHGMSQQYHYSFVLYKRQNNQHVGIE